MSIHRVKRLRVKLQLTQPKLAKLLGVSTATVSKWEVYNLQPSTDLMEKIRKLEEKAKAKEAAAKTKAA